MPTTSETTGQATAARNGNTDALEGVYDSLRSGEATGEEAVAATIRAFTDFVRAVVPAGLSEPARVVDLSFELVQQTMNFQRRLIFEVLSGFQRIVSEPWSVLDGESSFKGHNDRGEARGRSTQRAA